MIQIKAPTISVEENADGSIAKITVEPLEKGLGLTLGNALRRMLLSALPGIAPVGVKIAGVMHEFSTIPNVVEDVVDIILNIKGLALRANSPIDNDDKPTIRIKTNKAGEVLAGDFDCGMNITVLNPEHHICTINEGGELDMEITVGDGRGYVGADKNKDAEQPIGYIPMDSIYTPVVAASYAVEDARVGQDINYDRLVLDVKTNGTTSAKEILGLASKILNEHISLFTKLNESVNDPIIVDGGKPNGEPDLLGKPIEDLDFSVRTYNCLKRAGILTVGDLIKKSMDELIKVRNLGQKSLDEIIKKLEEMSLTLRSNDD